jgi:hypothetical protein
VHGLPAGDDQPARDARRQHVGVVGLRTGDQQETGDVRDPEHDEHEDDEPREPRQQRAQEVAPDRHRQATMPSARSVASVASS